MNKKKHLTGAERIKIETLLAQGFSIRSIADFLEKSPSTISREIQKHSLVKIPNSCDCNDYNGCNVKQICGSKDCNKKCRSCHLAKKYFEHYNKRSCEHWNGSSIIVLSNFRHYYILIPLEFIYNYYSMTTQRYSFEV